MLSVEALTCSFGGVMAVSRVSFSVQRGELFGLIGPNGAGKTTLFNLITGLSAPTAGRLRYQGRDITGLRPHRIAGLGIARTFQNVRLFGELSALQNVMIARHVRTTSGLVGGVIGLPSARAEERETRRRALALLELVGLADRPDERARNFAYGDQLRTRLGLTILLIEHHVPLVMDLCDRIAVLNFGELIALGAPANVQRDAAVIEAYLGDEV
ncbi:MAG: high-affinity branched-chain amino acid ABC transporter ATP-binding protein LivG [Candidatus Rokuibacteriota bacterium]|nr:MAG: high-affinity branched-chain amino acid ABC transporter ATP-binding protein LivG [Candidatus Rokubacteria bacterium]